jgi:aryl-alcohol dehydrogenase (NADP+)
MHYVNLGRTGLKISRLCLGCMSYGRRSWREWVLDENEARSFYQRALEAGINFFDTADMYSEGASEEVTGRALRDLAKRDQVIIATKVFNPMGEGPNDKGSAASTSWIRSTPACAASAPITSTLYYIHRFDYDTPIEETMEVLHDV